MPNLFENLRALPEELTETLVSHSNVRIERIVSNGHTSPEDFWYDQDEHEWVVVLQGEARLDFGSGRTTFLQQGDYLLIPAHQKHRVSYTQPDQLTIWLAVFYRS